VSATIATAMTEAELDWLTEKAKGLTVLEIGAFKGASTVALARSARQVLSVDPHVGDAYHWETTFAEFSRNVNANGVDDKVIPVIGRSQDVMGLLDRKAFGLVFIDGDHSFDAVWHDAHQGYRVAAKNGILAFHDYGIDQDGIEVQRAVDTMAKEGHHFVARGPGTIAYIEKE